MAAFRTGPVVIAVALLLLGLLAPADRAQAKELHFSIEMRGIAFSPNVLRVEPGDNVTIVVFNNSTFDHTFDLDPYDVHLGTLSSPISPGQNRSATFTALAGTFYFYCSVTGHATNPGTRTGTGMVGTLQVGEPASGDPTIVIVVGVILLAATLAAVVYFARRKEKKPESP